MAADLKARFARIHALLEEIEREMEATGAKMKINRGNGKGPVIQAKSEKIETVHTQIKEIIDSGVVIKDLKQGLVDFPHFLNGDEQREVFLCFLIAEDTVRYWHEIDAGFAGRNPL